jgi:hypothetical protein
VLDEPWEDDGAELPRGPAHRRRKDRKPVSLTAPTLAREPRRVAVLVLVGAILALAGFGSGAVRPPRGTSAVVPAAAAAGGLPVVVAAAKSSAWYCPGPIPLGPGAGAGSIVLTGTAGRAVRGRVTIARSDGSSATTSVVVPAGGTTAVPVVGNATGTGAGWAAASVVLDGGGVGAEQVVVAPNGPSAVPCQVTSSSTWYFPAGSTAPGADVHISLYNPTAAPAIASLSFSTSSELTTTGAGQAGGSVAAGAPAITPVQPPDLQGISVPAGQLVVVDVGRQVQLQPEIAASVTTAAGRLVAGEWSTVILGGVHEASLAQGVAQERTTWWFPLSDVTVPGADAIAFWLYNPTSVATSAQLLLPVGATETSSISVVVPPESLVVVSPPAAARPPGRHTKPAAPPPEWAKIESSQAGLVVARAGISEQSRARGSGRGGRLPPGVVGTGLPGAVIGASSPTDSCLLLGTGPLSASSTRAAGRGALAVTAPASWSGTVSVQVEVLVGGASSPAPVVLGTVTVDPGTVHVINLPTEVPPSVALLLVGGPVVAERDYGTGGSAGSLDSIGIPVD